jgi:hypothetical protein
MFPRAMVTPVLTARKQQQPSAVVAQEPRPTANILPGEHFIVTSGISSDSVKNGLAILDDLVITTERTSEEKRTKEEGDAREAHEVRNRNN